MENCYNMHKFQYPGGLTVANLQLASNLRKYREANGFTQDYISLQLNISRQAYSNYERGNRNPDIDLLIRLCNLYKITLNQLILEPFSQKNLHIKESNDYSVSGTVYHSEETLFLSYEEAQLLLKYREAEKEKKYVIETILYAKKES